jgi:rifampicin phosphotransferase
MDTKFSQSLDDQNATLEVAGGKGASLARMSVAGLPVPPGYCVTTNAYRHFVAENGLQPRILEGLEFVDGSRPETLEAAARAISRMFKDAPIPVEIANAVVQAYDALPGISPAVAVRSSATAEDLPEASFAGQQETYLNVIGADAVLEGIRNCWASLWTARAIDYRARHGITAEGVALAVVVQLLVDAEASGILFTANPVDGSRDQMVVNASWGLGEAVVGGLVTPDTLVIDKPSGKVITCQTAEKRIQIVRVEGGIQEKPVPVHLRNVPVLNNRQADELVHLGNQIEALYGTPMDIEWTLAEGRFAIVQARPITALPEPEPSLPISWKLPKGAYAAMRNNIVELMVDPLTPLFKTLGLRAVNTSMKNTLSGFFGNLDILPEDPIITVNEYAYYNGSVKFTPMLKIILQTRGIMKRMFTGAVERWTEEGHPCYVATVDRWGNEDPRQLPATEILGAVQALTEAAIDAYLTLVSGVIPAAWISEGLFTLAYKLVRRRDDPGAPVYLMGFDSVPIRAEKALYDLAIWAQKRTKLAAYLNATPTTQLVTHLEEQRTPSGIDPVDWSEWQSHFKTYLQDFGHTIYNLDFGSPVPADDPAPVLETLKLFLSGQGVNPHERQQESARRRERATEAMRIRLKGMRLKIFQSNLERAQRYAPLREDGLADVGLAYPLLRQMLIEIGRRMVEAGSLEKAGDIFWLMEYEVQDAATRLDRGQNLESFSARIPQRKAIWRAARRVAPPMMLPQLKIFGFDLMQLKTGRPKGAKGNTLKGVAASPGSMTAPACVIHGTDDFARMRSGDVLVAPLTTPAWTILFARASAVVTDVGGPLSHGSIVAREYGIPAVLGTGAATKRIRNGQVITVDGSAGVVILEKG